MDRVTITIKTTNSAFVDDAEYEIARILRELAERFENNHHPRYNNDINGNVVCKIEYE